MSEDKETLLRIRKKQLYSLEQMVESLRQDYIKLKNDNLALSQLRNDLLL